ncbi:MAG: cytochrome C [Rubrivivax sp.]|nr:cytochrome C [Rubrivivax sp.]
MKAAGPAGGGAGCSWLGWLRGVAIVLAACCGAGAPAQGLESALSPGPLIRGHQKVEGECAKCHVRFDRAAQDRLCIDCHKEVGQDLRAKAGMHGRFKPQPCRACHTDHRGPDMRIAEFDRRAFDHRATDYPLAGRHADVKCDACHLPGKKFREAPLECVACHKKDDKHKATLGPKCGDCHGEQSWKDVKLDHGKTRFPLTGKHADVKCDACHKSTVYNEAPLTCIGCHRKDDKHKARYGEKCDSCHNARRWGEITFRHDTDTRFALRGKHREARCDSCHTGMLYREKLGTTCIDCHRKDDTHKGSLGTNCVACHVEGSWRETARFDHDKTRFKLRGGHVKAECKSCHTTADYRAAPSACIGCHKKDDKHEATLGTDCAACHTDANWKASRFDHDKTKFRLTGKHAVPPLKCAECHRDLKSFRGAATECLACHKKDDKHEGTLGADCASCHAETSWKAGRFDHARTKFALTHGHAVPPLKCTSCHRDLKSYRPTALECVACHKKDDKHEGQLGARCDSCHGSANWRVAGYDHSRARVALVGGHLRVECKACHKSLRYRDAPRECVGCHLKDDKHKARFGVACESCHNARDWRLWNYDHAKRSGYRLEGKHARAACEACHRQAAPPGKAAAALDQGCTSCHRQDDVHDGSFGPRCEQCHGQDNWKQVNRRMRTSQGYGGGAASRVAGRRGGLS